MAPGHPRDGGERAMCWSAARRCSASRKAMARAHGPPPGACLLMAVICRALWCEVVGHCDGRGIGEGIDARATMRISGEATRLQYANA
jgi:hypothetical protein